MDSAEDNFKKLVRDTTNGSTSKDDSDDMDSDVIDSEEIGCISTKKNKEGGRTSDHDEGDETSDKAEAAVVQMLKEKEDKEKEVEDPDYGKAYNILTTEEVAQKESQTEGKDFRVLQNEWDSKSPGEELLSSYFFVQVFYCRI